MLRWQVSDSIRDDCSSIHSGKMDEKIEQKAGCVTKDQYDSFVEDAKMDWLSELIIGFLQ